MCYCFPVCLSSLTFDKLRSFVSRSPSSRAILMMLVSTCHTTSVSPLKCIHNARDSIIVLISAFGLLLFDAAKLGEPEVYFVLGFAGHLSFTSSHFAQICLSQTGISKEPRLAQQQNEIQMPEYNNIIVMFSLSTFVLCSKIECNVGMLSISRTCQTLMSAILSSKPLL